MTGIVVAAAFGAVVGFGTRRLAARWTAGAPIPTWWCETACAAGFAAAAYRTGVALLLVPACALVWWMIAVSVVDLRVRRLPNTLTLPGAACAVAVATVAGHGRAAVVGALLLAGTYLVLHLIAPGSMGAGDVKLALGLGAVTGVAGASTWLTAAALAPVVTAVVGLAWRNRGAVIAHGPSMCAATAVSLWWV
ncbi:prepilin peptidase [Prescottella subtropica]|uniref:prepilin peptidase n=1 Tax=Prescottella subtropica TaxID=2545757 RepID=UPI0010F6A047|nr:A24 family peptidase [Prescottella subtropica]